MERREAGMDGLLRAACCEAVLDAIRAWLEPYVIEHFRARVGSAALSFIYLRAHGDAYSHGLVRRQVGACKIMIDDTAVCCCIFDVHVRSMREGSSDDGLCGLAGLNKKPAAQGRLPMPRPVFAGGVCATACFGFCGATGRRQRTNCTWHDAFDVIQLYDRTGRIFGRLGASGNDPASM